MTMNADTEKIAAEVADTLLNRFPPSEIAAIIGKVTSLVLTKYDVAVEEATNNLKIAQVALSDFKTTLNPPETNKE